MKKKRISVWTDHRIPWLNVLIFMKFLSVLLLGVCISAQATVSAQQVKVTLNVKQTPLNEVFLELRRQTKCDFLYNYNIIKDKQVDVQVTEMELVPLLNDLLPSLGLEFLMEKNVIIIKEKTSQQQNIRVRGKVTDEKKQPLSGVTVFLEGTTTGTSTGRNGEYTLTFPVMEKMVLVYSFIGMKTKKMAYDGKEVIDVVMEESIAALEEVIISTGYQRFNLQIGRASCRERV